MPDPYPGKWPGADRFANLDDVSAPARQAFAIVPNNDDPLEQIPKAVHVGTTGDITGRLIDSDEDVTFENCQAGMIYPYRFLYVRETGTTSEGLIGLT